MALPQVTASPSLPFQAVKAATTTGVGASPVFSLSDQRGAYQNLMLEAVGAGATPTTVTVSLSASLDGGTTFQTVSGQSAIALVATSTGTIALITGLPVGPLYQVNVGTLTLGSATSVTVWGCLSGA